MSLISGVFNNYVVPAALCRPMVIGAGCIMAVPALELVQRVSEDYALIQRYDIPAIQESTYNKSARLQKKEQLKNTLLIRGIGVLTLGACALNLFPGSGALGLLGCLTYSRYNWKNEIKNANPCLSLFVTGFALDILSHYKTEIAKAIFSKVKTTGLAIGSFLYKIAMKVSRFSLAIFHALRSTTKVIFTLFKKLGSLFKSFVKHPRLGLGLLVGLVCLIGCVKYGHQLTGAAGVIARTINAVAGNLFTAGAFIGRGIGKTIRPLGTAASYIPMVLVKTVNGVKAVVYFIFHPLQAMGIAKVKTSA
jgi:hypothetical protein